MKLSTAGATLFFRLMWGLQLYVNQQCQVLSNVDSVEAYTKRPMEDLSKVRTALWERPRSLSSPTWPRILNARPIMRKCPIFHGELHGTLDIHDPGTIGREQNLRLVGDT